MLDVTPAIPSPEADDYLVRLRDKVSDYEPRKSPAIEWTTGDTERLARTLENAATAGARVVTVAHPRLAEPCECRPG